MRWVNHRKVKAPITSIIHLYIYPIQKKNVEPAPVARSTYLGSRIALSVETSNADQPHEMYIYTMILADDRVQLWLYRHQRGVYLHTPNKGHFPLLCSWQIVLNLRDSSKSKPKRPENAFFSMFFLAHRQVVARGNHAFAPTFLRHDEPWACFLCGCHSVQLMMSVRDA